MEYGHLPAPIRGSAGKISDWVLNKEIHIRFAAYLNSSRNRRMATVEAIFTRETNLGFPAYFAEMGKAKTLEQWKSRALAVYVPSDCVLACRCINDVGRLLAVAFMATTENHVVAADMKSIEHFIDDDVKRYLAS